MLDESGEVNLRVTRIQFCSGADPEHGLVATNALNDQESACKYFDAAWRSINQYNLNVQQFEQPDHPRMCA